MVYLGTMAGSPSPSSARPCWSATGEVCQALKRAEVSRTSSRPSLPPRWGCQRDRRGQGLQGVVRRRGCRVTVDARAAVARMVERLAGVVDRETLEGRRRAIADATKKGTTTEPGPSPVVGPNIEAEVLAAMQGGGDERARNSSGKTPPSR